MKNINFDEYKKLVGNICRDIAKSNWRPDYIVGITRGGLLPAVMISHYFSVPCHTLKVSLRDGDTDCESNCWMAEDAFGHVGKEINFADEDPTDLLSEAIPKNILIVDDINDTGATLNWIMIDWQSSCMPDDPYWEQVWNNNVKFAVIIDKLSSKCRVGMDYVGLETEEDIWINFPYENWWSQ